MRTGPWHSCILGKQGSTELYTEALQVMLLVYVVSVCSQVEHIMTDCSISSSYGLLSSSSRNRVMCPRVSEGLDFDDAINVMLSSVYCGSYELADSWIGSSTWHLLFLGEKKLLHNCTVIFYFVWLSFFLTYKQALMINAWIHYLMRGKSDIFIVLVFIGHIFQTRDILLNLLLGYQVVQLNIKQIIHCSPSWSNQWSGGIRTLQLWTISF